MECYLQKAISDYDSIGPLAFLNVIRILQGQSPILNGVSGEDHYTAIRKLNKNKLNNIEIIFEDNSEDEEVIEIASAYLKKNEQFY